MSIQLVLSHYLAGLKERNELDALLPDLLRSMGHSVLSRPQIGVAQAGVDVLSTCAGKDGATEVFIFIIKFGDVGVADLYVGRQAIEPSVRQAASDFVQNRLPRRLQAFRKNLILLTNGSVKQEAQAGFKALVDEVGQRPDHALELWGLDQLTPLIERHLFSEALLLNRGTHHLRAATASLDENDTAIRRFVGFVDACFEEPAQKGRPTKKRFSSLCSAALMGWSVLIVWGRDAGNLKPAVICGEYVLLRLWAEAVELGATQDKLFLQQFARAARMLVDAQVEYFHKVLPSLHEPEVLLRHRRIRPLYVQLVFEEFGRLATLLLMLPAIPEMVSARADCRSRLVGLVNMHKGCCLPVLDGQTIDLTLVLSALLSCGDRSSAMALMTNTISRLEAAFENRRYLPIDTDVIEDAVSLDFEGGEVPDDYFKTSTLVPALRTVAGICGAQELLDRLNQLASNHMSSVTLERWFPSVAVETMARTHTAVAFVGVSRGLRGLPGSCADELEASNDIPKNAGKPGDFACMSADLGFLLAVSARFHRHPMPTWLICGFDETGQGQAALPTEVLVEAKKSKRTSRSKATR